MASEFGIPVSRQLQILKLQNHKIKTHLKNMDEFIGEMDILPENAHVLRSHGRCFIREDPKAVRESAEEMRERISERLANLEKTERRLEGMIRENNHETQPT